MLRATIVEAQKDVPFLEKKRDLVETWKMKDFEIADDKMIMCRVSFYHNLIPKSFIFGIHSRPQCSTCRQKQMYLDVHSSFW